MTSSQPTGLGTTESETTPLTGKDQDTAAPAPLSRNRAFQAMWVSRFFAGMGKEATEVAYPLLTLSISGSAAYAGAVGSLQLVAAAIATMVGGDLADRFDRRKLLWCCDTARIVLLAGFVALALSGALRLPVVFLVAICSAACVGVAKPVELAVVKQLVDPTQISTATAQNQIRFFGTTVAGPPIGGSLFPVSRSLPFVAELLCYLVSAPLLLLVRRPLPPASPRHRDKQRKSEGIQFLLRQRVLALQLCWITGFNMVFTHTGAFLALIATAQSRGADGSTIGMMISLTGAGGLLGAFGATYATRRVRPSTVFLTAAWLAPVSAVLLATLPGVLPLGLVLGAVFALLPTVNATFFAYVAAIVPNELQGRVLGAVSFMSMVAQPVGIFGVGVIFDVGGPTWVFTWMATVSALAALVTLTPTMRRLPRPEDLT